MKDILITGVSSGTGLGLTEKFIREGHRVIGSVRNRDSASELQSRFGDSFVPLVFDITDENQVADAADELEQRAGIGHLSAIINNAGSAEIGPLLHVPPADFRRQLDVLVVGQLAVIQSFYRFLLADDSTQEVGRIFNISSISGVGRNYLFGCYAAGKHALEGLSKTLRKECEPYGIPVIVVAPGNIATAIWDKQTDDILQRYRGTNYFDALRSKISQINAEIPKHAMSVEEFSDAFFGVFEDSDPAERYTIIRSKNKRNPFSKVKLRVLRK